MKARVNRQSGGISNNLVRKRIQTIAKENGLSEQIQFVLLNLFDYMMKKQIYGCCHALSSALYVALCELGESPQLYVGECFTSKEEPFDHSWITLNGKIIDIAIYMPLSQKCNSVTGVVVMDIDTSTQKKVDTQYGYETGLDFDYETKVLIQTPFVEYMNAYPFERNGLWTVVQMILSDTFEFDVNTIKDKYANTERIIYSKKGEGNVHN